MNKYYEIFRRNFPFVVRNDQEALNIINNSSNKFLEVNDEDGNLIAISIINKNTIILLCVDEKHRKQGIGEKLLIESEKYILSSGYNDVNIGAGFDYLMPGIPMATKPFNEELKQDKIYENVTNEANDFFIKRGYLHSWNDANCFDMRANLEEINFPNVSIGDTIDGIEYRFATLDDLPDIIKCTDNAYQEFTKYYKNKKLYNPFNDQVVLIAKTDKDICGTLIISKEYEEKGLGSVGCTIVSNKYRGKHIGVNMVVLGTKYLKSIGLKDGFLGYTYSGLDKMYGYAGYKICVYYNMAHKNLILKKEKVK